MAKKKDVPMLIKIHNSTCPAWLLNIGLLKKIEPGCRMATGYQK